MKVKSVPTKRAPDAGESAHISSSFLRLSIFQLDGFAVPAPAQVTQTVRQTKNKTKYVFDSPFRFADCVWNLGRPFFYINFVCLCIPRTPRNERGVRCSVDLTAHSLVRNSGANYLELL